MSLRDEILKNEELLLKEFGKDFNLAIKYFMGKIKALNNDGDIVKFLNNPSIRVIKKDQYDAIHEVGLKTAIDIMDEYKENICPATEIEDLKEGDLVTSLTICALANNFNHQKGMYYNKDKNIVLLKTQIKNGAYADSWIERNQEIKYFLENEKESFNYINKTYTHIPNIICNEIIAQKNTDTKVYLFYRYADGNRYNFGGEYKPKSHCDNNKAIILVKV